MVDIQQFTDYVYRFPDVQHIDQTLMVLKIQIESINENEINFDIIGLKPFFVNTIRQLILNEIPTMAIEDVYFQENTSTLFNCDYIAQRLALIPIVANPNDFKFRNKNDPERLNSNNCIVMKLNRKNTSSQTIKVYAEDIKWEPIGARQHLLSPITLLYPKIPIMYLKPNEEIICRLHCVKGRGLDHMKFSPGFARYYFHSQITLKDIKTISTETVQRIKSSFPAGVIETKIRPDGRIIPIVANERLDHHTRSFKNFEDVANAVQVKYYRDHLIFIIESYGVKNPAEMFINALDIFQYKIKIWEERIRRIKTESETKSKSND
ncbi:DNA-directed RNA polymerases I and III subunit RPAC1-like [Dermatophagoides pteronyssinus]|uniref:DNA-directed RNA polymerases I and III subunit RPAC1-like n=1 Tax=Dermatophagoides pteronyssinus TaxID=6956 RepID=UPI003F663C5C